MNKEEIINALKNNHAEFLSLINGFSDQDLQYAPAEKWSAGQQLDHIYKSVSPLTTIFSFPKILIRLIFGKANRPSKSFDDLVEKYHRKLQQGGKASGRFIPRQISPQEAKKLIVALRKSISKLNRQAENFTEKQLDHLILPHPLLGKLTIREMLYFTIYHVTHHQKSMLKNLETMVKTP